MRSREFRAPGALGGVEESRQLPGAKEVDNDRLRLRVRLLPAFVTTASVPSAAPPLLTPIGRRSGFGFGSGSSIVGVGALLARSHQPLLPVVDSMFLEPAARVVQPGASGKTMNETRNTNQGTE